MVIRATEVVGDVARVVMNRVMAGDLEVKVHGGAEAIRILGVDLTRLISESMQEAGWK